VIEDPKPGQIVQHLAGGVRMTVTEVQKDDIFCHWFFRDQHGHGCFPPAVLQRLEDVPNAEDLRPGQVVRLRSGGPTMAISAVERAYADCEWFDAENELHRERYSVVSLALAGPPLDPEALRTAARTPR
jgi:uncharacterized protein YodC (DUF2158 family)